jgi:nitrate/TMAO reductase-like tetraheme cytochrome c subunit
MLAGAVALVCSCVGPEPVGTPDQAASASAPGRGQEYFFQSEMCRNCHSDIYDQHQESMHARSLSNPAFRAMYFDHMLPEGLADPEVKALTDECFKCHNPIYYYYAQQGHATPADPRFTPTEAVTCDFCHTITGFTGRTPGNGNYIVSPGTTKYGPFPGDNDWHQAYNKLYTKSEYCAICHNSSKSHDLPIKSTYSEWRESEFARRGVDCQDCHMSVYGFQLDGVSYFMKGRVAQMTGMETRTRPKVFTHRFPGAHEQSQIFGNPSVEVRLPHLARAGDEITIEVRVNNSRVGHSMPSGSSEIRMLWMELTALPGEAPVLIPARSRSGEAPAYDVAGATDFDRTSFGSMIPAGSRLYRTVFDGVDGYPTLINHEAARVAFDNRLRSAEVRAELYTFRIPERYNGMMSIEAQVKYTPYPPGYAKILNIPEPEPVTISSARADLVVGR